MKYHKYVKQFFLCSLREIKFERQHYNNVTICECWQAPAVEWRRPIFSNVDKLKINVDVYGWFCYTWRHSFDLCSRVYYVKFNYVTKKLLIKINICNYYVLKINYTPADISFRSKLTRCNVTNFHNESYTFLWCTMSCELF